MHVLVQAESFGLDKTDSGDGYLSLVGSGERGWQYRQGAGALLLFLLVGLVSWWSLSRWCTGLLLLRVPCLLQLPFVLLTPSSFSELLVDEKWWCCEAMRGDECGRGMTKTGLCL